MKHRGGTQSTSPYFILHYLLHGGMTMFIHRLSKMPLGVADRDLVQNISHRYDKDTNTTYLMYHHATHPSKPEVPGVVRSVVLLMVDQQYSLACS